MSVADILSLNSLVSGSYVSTWTTTMGFTSPPPTVRITWHRLGNIVVCNFIAFFADGLAGVNTANITLPLPRTTPFSTDPTECSGSCFCNNVGFTAIAPGLFTPLLGSTNSATLTTPFSAPLAAMSFRGGFSYSLS